MSAEHVVKGAEALVSLLRAGVASLDDDDLRRVIALAGEARRALDVIAADAGAEVGERLLHVRLGERTAADAVATGAGVALDEARAWCVVGAAIAPRWALTGETLEPERPAIAEALRSGSLGVRDALTILRTLDRVRPFAGSDVLLDVERALVERAPGMTARDLERLARRTIDLLDPDGTEPREDLLRLRSGVQVARTPDGLVRWILTMHPEAAGFLTAAVDARTAPRRLPRFADDDAVGDPVESDPRPLGQRRLDALVAIARESLAHDDGMVAGTAVTLMVTMTLADLRSGLGSAEIAGVDEPLSAATARRLAADAEMIPVVLGGPSEVLDQGRAVRLFTPAQRRAMAVRDGGCVWPGCNAPPSWCEAAHRLSWLEGGPTDLWNSVLLCGFHHRRHDHDGWRFDRDDDGQLWLIPPAHVDAWRAPRRAGRLLTPALPASGRCTP